MTETDPREALRRDGYVVIRDAVGRRRLSGLLDGFRDVFRRQIRRLDIADAGARGSAFDTALAALFRSSMPDYLAAAKLTQYLPALHALGAGEDILAILRRLGLASPVISTRPVVHIVADALKVPDGYHRTPPHQDWRSVQGSLDSLVLWLPLVPADEDFAPLEVLPGSHRAGLLPSEPHPFANRVAPAAIDEAAFRPVSAAPGDVVAFSMFLVHRTGARQRPGVRWSVSFRYNNLDEPGFVERGYPNPYIYKPREDLLAGDPPGPAAMARIYGDD
jgi:ectoine hydroxylase-related dioxygenase (phytanoyl-CoA dioxygenase family)